MSNDFEGIFPYIVSPVNKNGEIMTESLRKLVNYLVNSGVHGITPLGSTGEFYYLTWEQKKKIVEVVLEEVNGRIPVVPGVASSNTEDAINQAKIFESMGVDGIVTVLNTYFPISQDMAYEYFSMISNSVNCPIVLYNNPKFTHFDMSENLIIKLSEIDNIKYYKDATGITGKLMPVLNSCGSKIKIFSASAHLPVFVMMLGGVGWMSGPSCLIPKTCVRMFNLCKDRNWDEALSVQKQIWEANRVFQKYNLAACVKAGLNMKGFDVGLPIHPNAPVSEEAKLEIWGSISTLD